MLQDVRRCRRSTNNALGIAGICNDCDLLDVKLFNPGNCIAPPALQPPSSLDNLRYARIWTTSRSRRHPRKLRRLRRYLPYNQVTALFYAYERGIPIIAGRATKGTRTTTGRCGQAIPFVIGVGGFTSGISSGVRTRVQMGTTVGPSIIDICGPAAAPVPVHNRHPHRPKLFVVRRHWTRDVWRFGRRDRCTWTSQVDTLDQQNNNPYATADDWEAGIVINSYRPCGLSPQPGYGCPTCLPGGFGPACSMSLASSTSTTHPSM